MTLISVHRANAGTTAQRLYFLDWIRIFAFMVLIAFHTGMYYASWDWNIKSPHASKAIEPLLMLFSPWRLGLLFMISGVASAFMLNKLQPAAFLRQRSARLLIPLLFGMLVIIPPQSYVEIVEKLAYRGSYVEFMKLYLTGYDGFRLGKQRYVLENWNHLWFVGYLWVYTVLLGSIVMVAGTRLQRWSVRLGELLAGWKLIVLPVAVLACLRLALVDRYPPTHTLFDDWYNHANYFFLFLLGALLATQTRVWQRAEEMRWVALGLALGGLGIVIGYQYRAIPAAALGAMATQTLTPLLATPEAQNWRPLLRAIYTMILQAMCQWAPIVAACGFGRRHLAFDSAKRSYLAQAVFPVYILHQTLIICMEHWFKPLRLAPGMEGTLLIALTFAVSFGMFEVLRRMPLLRPLFGLGRERAPAQTRAPAAASAQRLRQ